MNINSLSQSILNKINKSRSAKKNQTAQLKFDQENKLMGASGFSKDDLLAQFWGMTNKMPKKDQISLAASVVASKVFQNGMTPENKTFIKNIKNRFSPDEIGNLESQVKAHPMIQGKPADKVADFMKDLDSLLTKQNSEIGALKRRQPQKAPRSPEEIFFQTTLKFGNFNKAAVAV